MHDLTTSPRKGHLPLLGNFLLMTPRTNTGSWWQMWVGTPLAAGLALWVFLAIVQTINLKWGLRVYWMVKNKGVLPNPPFKLSHETKGQQFSSWVCQNACCFWTQLTNAHLKSPHENCKLRINGLQDVV